jgi:ABC-type multidrug transport system fused ATPase/permease subunit
VNLFLKIFDVFDYKQKINFILLLVLIFFNTLLEMISIGLILPLIALLTQDNFIEKYYFILIYFNFFFELNKINLIYFFIIFLTAVFFVKNILILLFSIFKYNFFFNILNIYSRKLYKIYINKDYSFFTKNNSSILIRNVDNVSIFSESINQILFFITDFLTILGLLILLMYFEFFGTMILLSIVLFSFFFYSFFTRSTVINFGNLRQVYQKKKIQSLYEGFSAIREIKIFFKEKFFINRYSNNLFSYSEASKMYEIFQSLPKLWLEMIGVISLSILIFLFLLNNKADLNIISMLAVYGASAFKIMPSLNRVISSSQFLIHYNSIIVEIIKQFKLNLTFSSLNNNLLKKDFNFKKSLKVNNLSFFYNKRKKIFSNLNFEIKKNETIGIIGKTGSGKSTFINILSGLIKANDGRITVDNTDIKSVVSNYNTLFAIIPQSIFLLDDSILSNVAFGIDKNKINRKIFLESIKLAQLDKFIKGLPLKENTNVGERGIKLSGGQIQRIGIARALYFQPKILILDEATSSLDQKTESEFMKMLYFLKRKITIIIVSHRMSTLIKCDKVFKIDNGKIKKISFTNFLS